MVGKRSTANRRRNHCGDVSWMDTDIHQRSREVTAPLDERRLFSRSSGVVGSFYEPGRAVEGMAQEPILRSINAQFVEGTRHPPFLKKAPPFRGQEVDPPSYSRYIIRSVHEVTGQPFSQGSLDSVAE
ncbi:hypothetical protein GCM10010980_21120 [Corynebacterium marinum]|nr:hypothetical protein GCM10010980_21120 [Corynebacterium marinum]